MLRDLAVHAGICVGPYLGGQLLHTASACGLGFHSARQPGSGNKGPETARWKDVHGIFMAKLWISHGIAFCCLLLTEAVTEVTWLQGGGDPGLTRLRNSVSSTLKEE